MRPRHLIAIAAALLLFAGGLTGIMAAAQSGEGQQFAQQGRGDGGGRGRRGGGGGNGGGRGQPVVLDAAQLAALKAQYVAPKTVPHPADNAPSAARLALGQRLFFDPSISATGKLACASCHDARRGFSDGLERSIGVKGTPLARHTQTVINLAWSKIFFWDGRASTLEEQAVMPINTEDEMGMPHDLMVATLRLDPAYRRQFDAAYPGEGLGVATVGKALAVFERSLVFTNSPFDRWIAGDENAISEEAKQGFIQFNTRGGCFQCHSGWNFSDDGFNDIGIPTDDLGRFAIAPGKGTRHAFKTPSLRNVAERAPYMHTGQFASLRQVIRHYDDFERRASLSPKMRNVRVGRGANIIAFLETLTSPTPPELIRLQEELDRRLGLAPRATFSRAVQTTSR